MKLILRMLYVRDWVCCCSFASMNQEISGQNSFFSSNQPFWSCFLYFFYNYLDQLCADCSQILLPCISKPKFDRLSLLDTLKQSYFFFLKSLARSECGILLFFLILVSTTNLDSAQDQLYKTTVLTVRFMIFSPLLYVTDFGLKGLRKGLRSLKKFNLIF